MFIALFIFCLQISDTKTLLFSQQPVQVSTDLCLVVEIHQEMRWQQRQQLGLMLATEETA